MWGSFFSVLVVATAPIEDAPLPMASDDCFPRTAPAAGVLFVNFDGAVLKKDCGNDAHYNCSTLYDRFDGYVGPFHGTIEQRAAIIDSVKQDLKAFNVLVTTTRPPPHVDYTMIIYGDLGPQSFAGLAPYIDCGDRFLNDVAFAQGDESPITGATVVLHEAGHTWGLEHVDSLFDLMFPVNDSVSASFTDECQNVVADTELTPATGSCTLAHTAYCDLGGQRSHQELLARFGPSVQDTIAPVVFVEAPAKGAAMIAGTAGNLVVTIQDDRAPQVYDLTLRVDGVDVLQRAVWEGLEAPLLIPDPGSYLLEVAATDPAGNTGETSRRVEVVAADADNFALERASSGCRAAAPSTRPATALGACCIALLGLGRRRRPRSRRFEEIARKAGVNRI